MKKLISFVLVFCMIFSSMLTVNATEIENSVEISGTITEDASWSDGAVVSGVTISGGTSEDPIEITVNGTVYVSGTIRLSPDTISNVVFKGTADAKLIRSEGFTGQMFYSEGVSGNFHNITFNNITLDGGAVWTGDVHKTLNRGTTNEGIKATGSVLYLLYTNAVLNESVLQNHDDSTSEKANAVFLRYYSTVSFNNSVVRNNNSPSTYYRGGVITVRQGGTAITNGAEVYGNSGAAGGFFGISATGSYGGIAEAYNTKFHNNYSDNGAVFLMQCNSNRGYLKIDGCEFYDNASNTAVLTEWAYSRPFIISNSTFRDNECAIWDCHADPVLDISGKIVIEGDPEYTKYLFETPIVLSAPLAEGSSIEMSEASLEKLMASGYIITGTAGYEVTADDIAKINAPEGKTLAVADINGDGIGDVITLDSSDEDIIEVSLTLKDSMNAEASETALVYSSIASLPVNPFKHDGLVFAGWVDADGNAVAKQQFTESTTLTATWKIETPVVKLSREDATLKATVSNTYNNVVYTYQWYKNDVAIEGATASTCTMTDVNSAAYKCEVTASVDGLASVTGSASGTSSAPAAAQIGDTKYATFKEAITAANATDGGATVTLLNNVTLSEKLTIKKNITISGAYTITRGTTDTIFAVDKNATLTLDGGVVIDGGNNWTFDCENFYADLAAGKTLSTGAKNSYSTAADGGIVSTKQLITISATKGAVVMNNATIQNVWANNHNDASLFSVPAGATLTVNEGALISHIRGSVVGQINGNWTMNGGKITDIHGHNTNGGLADMRGSSTITINGGEICYVTLLGLNANGNGILAQVYGNTTKLCINDGYIHDNASFSPGGGWGSIVYLNRGGDFEMNGGTIKHTLSDHCTAFVSNTSTSIVLNAGTIVVKESTAARFDSLIYGNVTIGEEMKIEGEGEAILLGDPGNTFENNGTIDCDIQIAYAEVSGNGIYNGNVIIKVDDYFEFDGKAVISGGTWNGEFTVEEGAELSITGGTFKNDVSEYCAEGFIINKLDDGSYGVVVDPAYGKVAQIGDNYYETLAEAITDANNADEKVTITLIDNITLSENLSISGDVIITGTHTITRADDYTGTLFTVVEGATLTLDGGLVVDGNNNWTFDEEGFMAALENATRHSGFAFVTSEEGAPEATAEMFKVSGKVVMNEATIKNHKSIANGALPVFNLVSESGAELTLNNGATITHCATANSSTVASVNKNTSVTINEGSLITDNYGAGNGALSRNNYGTITMNGGSIKENYSVDSNGSVFMIYGSSDYRATFNMYGGEICSNLGVKGASNNHCSAIYIRQYGDYNMTGGIICHNSGYTSGGVVAYPNAGTMLNISGGDFHDNKSLSYGDAMGDLYAYPSSCNITGGSFESAIITELLAPGHEAIFDEETGKFGVVYKPAAKVSGVSYATIEEAIAAAKAAGTSVDVLKTIVLKTDGTFDLQGVRLNASASLQNAPVVLVLADVTITNGIIDGRGPVAGEGGINCDAIVVGNETTPGTLTINDGTYRGVTSAIYIINGTANISGGIFQTGHDNEGENYGAKYLLKCEDSAYVNGTAKFNITGGRFNYFNPENNTAQGEGTNFLADPYKASDYYNDDKWYVAEANVVMDGDKYFATIKDALATLSSADTTVHTVKVLKDLEIDVNYNTYNYPILVNGFAIELDLNGKTITADWSKYTGSRVDNALIGVCNGGKLTIIDSVGGGKIINNDDKANVENRIFWIMTSTATKSLEVTIKGGTFIQNDINTALLYVQGNKPSDNLAPIYVTIEGGHFETVNDDFFNAYDGYQHNSYITGGTFNKNPSDWEIKIHPDFEIIENEDGTFGVTELPDVAIIGDKNYKYLDKAIEAVKDGETITLVVDYSDDITICQKEGVSFTLDGDGHTFTGTIYVDGTGRYNGAESLTITNINFVTDEASHYFIDSNASYSGNNYNYAHNVTIKNCTFTATEGSEAVKSAAAMRFRQSNNVNIINCEAENMHSMMQAYGIKTLTVEGAVINNCKNGISVGASSDVKIVNSNINTAGYGIRADGNVANTMTITGGTISASMPVIVRKTTEAYNLNVSGITFNAAEDYSIIITAGDDDIDALVAPSVLFSLTETANINAKAYPNSLYVATIGEYGYLTLGAAVEAANKADGDVTIELIKDITLEEKLTITNNVTITGECTITRADSYTGTLFAVNKGATLTLDGGLVVDGNNNWELNSELYNNALDLKVTGVTWADLITSEEGKPNATAPMFKVTGSVVANNVTIQNNYSSKSSNNGDYGVFQVDPNATLTMNGATIKHIVTGGANSVAHLSTDSVWTINDGTLITDTFAGKNGGICRNDSGKLVMNGGTIEYNRALNTNGTVVMLYKGSMEMNGGKICSNTGISGNANSRCAVIYGHSTSTFIMTDGEICHNTGISYGGVDVPSSIKVEISGGYVGDNISVVGNANADVNGNSNTVITGGTFKQDVSEWLAPNTGLAYDEATGTYTVTAADMFELVNTGNKFNSLNAAMDAIENGNFADTPVIKILLNCNIGETVSVKSDVIFDLNGKNVHGNGIDKVIEIDNNASVTVINKGSIQNTYGLVFNLLSGKLTIENGKFKGKTTVVNVEKGHLVVKYAEMSAAATDTAPVLIDVNDYNYYEETATVVVHGGLYSNWNPSNNTAAGDYTNLCYICYYGFANANNVYEVRQEHTLSSAPTCMSAVYCTVCGEKLAESGNHVDENGDGNCDLCYNGYCSNCGEIHDNFIAKIFCAIISFFKMIFAAFTI